MVAFGEYVEDGTASAMKARDYKDATDLVAHPVLSFKSGQSEAAGGVFITEDFAPTLQAQNNGSTATPAVFAQMAVRRLTPTECERLQGFPDGYTDIQLNGKPTPDGPRYKALGNSMAVPVMRWIGQRIAALEPRSANP
jgi:DNA (cytosine-5)-methyltransferase 1